MSALSLKIMNFILSLLKTGMTHKERECLEKSLNPMTWNKNALCKAHNRDTKMPRQHILIPLDHKVNNGSIRKLIKAHPTINSPLTRDMLNRNLEVAVIRSCMTYTSVIKYLACVLALYSSKLNCKRNLNFEVIESTVCLTCSPFLTALTWLNRCGC